MFKYIFISFAILFIGCAQKPIIKYVYVKQQCPKIQHVNVTDLNLSKSEPMKLHIRIKDAK